MATLENPFEKVRSKMVAARIELISQLAKFEHDELTVVPAPDAWSALEIAHHVYVADGLALEQLQMIQSEENPLIGAPEEEAPHRTRASEPPVSLEARSEEHTSELQSHLNLVCRLLLEKKKQHQHAAPQHTHIPQQHTLPTSR